MHNFCLINPKTESISVYKPIDMIGNSNTIKPFDKPGVESNA